MVGHGGRIRSEFFFLSDFHTGSHSDDVARLEGIVAEARAFNPDLVLLGGDFVNMQLFGAGRVPPKVIAAVLARLDARYGQFAVLGNHDYLYGAQEIASGMPLRWRVPPEFVVLDVTGPPDAAISTVAAATGRLSASTV